MMTLKGGPCAGSFGVKRAPLFLRATRTPGGKTDVLDQLGDRPAPNERVYVYRQTSGHGTVHVRGRGFAGFYVLAEYEYMPDVDGEALRDNATWQAWAKEQPL